VTPEFGTIVRDQSKDVGLVLDAKGDRVVALWEASGKVLSVFRDTISQYLDEIDHDDILMVGSPESGFLGVSNQALRRIRSWAPRFPTPVRRLKHSGVLVLSRDEARPGTPCWSLWEDFDGCFRNADALTRVLSQTEALHLQMGHRVKREHQQGRLGAMDTVAQRVLSHEGHRAYTQVKRDIVLAGDDFKFLSEEQRLATAATTLPTLVTARAGTGKTTTLVARASSLISDLGAAPEEILILAFNKKAAMEITERLERQFPGKPIPTALTFHALAYQIVKPQTKPLLDEEGGSGDKELSRFIEDTIRENWNPHFEACIRKILSDPTHEQWLENGLMNAPDEQYLKFRLRLPHFSLRGEKVKSAGEKYIADFYTCHDLDYQYEKGVKWGDRWYFPDFTLLREGKQVVHEHWGVSSIPGNKSVPWNWTKSHADYRADMERKRAFLETQGVPLLETSIDDLRGGRLAFEALLSEKLNALGIHHHPLDEKELLRRIIPLQKNRIRAIFSSFIVRMKSGGYTIDSIWEKIRACHSGPDTEAFLNICTLIFAKYQERLNGKERYDFNDLLDQAVLKLRQEGPSRTVIKTQKYRVDLARLRYVMIDEFQDFNLQFSNLIAEIKRLNASFNLFCVGDDWQAINAFMGADTRHFFDFRNADSKTMNLSLSLTRRCPKSHVERSNNLMRNMGGISVRSKKEDGHTPIRIEKVPENMNILVRKIVDVIREHGRETSFAVLFRTNSFQGREIEEIYRKVSREYSEQFEESWVFNGRAIKLDISTVHRFKGKEADVVILADASALSYPMLHPDTVFFEPFGDTPAKVIRDERRLFYVALTRAKNHLWIFYDDKFGPSPFLEDAGIFAPRRGLGAIPKIGARRLPQEASC